jgi:hypothetical protein
METVQRLSCGAAIVLAASLVSAQQQQQPSPRTGWPCGGRLDPSYFRVAEGTGGHLLLLAPEEIGDSATLLTALGAHPQTIFRLAGSIPSGLHDFQVPIDPSVDSVVFSFSVQCLQSTEVVPPSGALPRDSVSDLSNFRAQRMVIVKRPEPGVWTVRVSGSGVAAVVVQAQSAIGIAQLQFAPAAGTAFTAVPAAGVENAVMIRMSGHTTGLRASMVSGVFEQLAVLALSSGDSEGTYTARFTPGAAGFRLLVTGKDDQGFAFQRMHAPLLTPAR